MTIEEVWIEILPTVTGQPEDEIRQKVALLKELMPNANWDEEVTYMDPQKLVEGLKAEAPKIKQYLIEGALRFERKINTDPDYIQQIFNLDKPFES